MSEVKAIIMAGTSDEWKESNLVQDLVARRVLTSYTGTNKLGDEYSRYFETNPEALKAFQERRDRGMNLSTRVWDLSEQYKQELEESITAAIAPGTSAVELAAQVKKYLKEPNKRFRRIKEKMEDGTIKWHLSKNAKAYHPGQGKPGVYRSSARNAQRLARTEINMSYRTAEQERWKQFDFVVGYEITTTQNGHHVEGICDDLAGKYPKTFKFTGWHPQCMCYCIPILKTEDEFWADDDDAKSINEISDVPQNFKDWINDNSDRIEAAEKHGKLPYFIRDNKDDVDVILHPELRKESAEINPLVNTLAEELKRNGSLEGSLSMDDREIMKAWWELSDEERLRVLEQGGFSGMISNEGNLEFASLYLPTSKESILATIQDELDNLKNGYDVEDCNHYVIKFKGKEPVNSYDLTKPLTKAEISRLEWISANEGMSNYRYWANNDKSLSELMTHMGFCEYKDGRMTRSWNGKDVLGNISDNMPHYGAAMKLGRSEESLSNRMAIKDGRVEGFFDFDNKDRNRLVSTIREINKKTKIFPLSFDITISDDLNDGTLMSWREGELRISNAIYRMDDKTSFCPARDLMSAFNKLKRKEQLSFTEEYSIESLFHESVHSRYLSGKFEANPLSDIMMEGCTQLYARERYTKILKYFKASPLHQDAIRLNGYGYGDVVDILRPFFTKDGELQIGELINIAIGEEDGIRKLNRRFKVLNVSSSERKRVMHILNNSINDRD